MLKNNPGRLTLGTFLVTTIAVAIYDPSPCIGILAAQENATPDQGAEVHRNPADELNNPPVEKRAGYLVQIALPVTPTVVASVEQTLDRLIEKSRNLVRAEDRPVVVLEFDTSSGKTGQGSDFESCLSLARFLGREEMNRLKTVAFIPSQRRVSVEDGAIGQTQTRLNGHAVLVAIAADEIAIPADVVIGRAGVDEKRIDPIIRGAYAGIADRLTLPIPVVMAMLEKDRDLYRVKTETGTQFVDRNKRDELENRGDVLETEILVGTDEMAAFTGQQLVDFGLVHCKLTESRPELARRFNLDENALEGDPTLGVGWKAMIVELPEYIDHDTVDWVLRALDQTITSNSANLIIFSFRSTGGDPDVCLQLARRIAEINANEIRTVAFINDIASGPAGVIALTCKQLIMTNAAILGGRYEPAIPDDQMADVNDLVQSIADTIQRDSAVMQAMINPRQDVIRISEKQTGQKRLLTDAQFKALKDQDHWLSMGPVAMDEGLDAATALRLMISRKTVANAAELETFYQLEEPPVSLAPTLTDQWLKKIAQYLASPFVAPWLLFAAMFFISTEMSQPGTGVPGFLGTLCLVAFFWSQHLDGNADWLEILLFITGVIFILLELLVIPGFGIFGIGGFLMVVCSIILASQTFIIPRNSAEFAKFPGSLMILAGALGGMIVAAITLRKVLPNAPFFKRIMLEPPIRELTGLEDDYDPEALVNWNYLAGRQGVAVTNLVPAGKAQIAGQVVDVISDGRMIEKGQKIEVVHVVGNRVVVQTLES